MRTIVLLSTLTAAVCFLSVGCASLFAKRGDETKAKMRLAFEAGKQHGYCDCLLNQMKVEDLDHQLAGRCEGYQTFEAWYWMEQSMK